MRTPSRSGCALLALLALPTAAAAQQPGDFTISPNIAIEANASGSGYMVNGVGAPAVAWDSNLGRYLMVYEVKLPQTDPACPVGMWGLGIAYSTTGPDTGWVTSPDPLLEPAPGTFYACVAANPSVVYNPTTSTLLVHFKGEQTDPPDPAIGPSRFTGVGIAKVKFRPAGGIATVTVEPTPALQVDQNFGMPKVVHKGADWEMMLSIYPDVWMATGTTPDSFTLDAAPILTADPATNPYWAVDELFNPALVCEDDPVFPYATFVGGRDLGVGAQILTAGWGKAISSDTDNWFLGADPYFEWIGDSDWRHWDVLRVDDPGGTEYLVWFSEKDAAGLNRIRFASTIDPFNPADIYSKDCP